MLKKLIGEKIKIIDVHTHIYDQHSHKFDEKVYFDYLAKAKKRVKKILVMSWYNPNTEELFKSFKSFDNLYLVGSVNMNGDIQRQLKLLESFFKEKKLFGIKLYPGYQKFFPYDEKVFPIANLCQKYNKPLIFHSGDVYSPKGDAMLKCSRPIHIDELAVKFPKCKIVISHFGFPYILETANIVSKNKNVFTDISGTLDELEGRIKKARKEMLIQYINDLKKALIYYPDIKKKIMFGTDFYGEETPLHEIDGYIRLVKKIFGKRDQKNVFYNTADNLYFKD